MTLKNFLDTLVSYRPNEIASKNVSEGVPFLPCVIYDDGHASLAVLDSKSGDKRFSYTDLANAFTFQEEGEEDPAVLENGD